MCVCLCVYTLVDLRQSALYVHNVVSQIFFDKKCIPKKRRSLSSSKCRCILNMQINFFFKSTNKAVQLQICHRLVSADCKWVSKHSMSHCLAIYQHARTQIHNHKHTLENWSVCENEHGKKERQREQVKQ